MKLKNGKYWLDTDTNKLMEINESTTGSDGKPCPPIDCVPVVVLLAENEADVYKIIEAIQKEDESQSSDRIKGANMEKESDEG